MKWRAVGFASVVLAAILLAAYLSRDRAVATSHNAPVPVLIARRLIPKGTPASIVVTKGMYRAHALQPNEEREADAVADPSYLKGRASVDILPGQQITATDFAAPKTP
jgi:hypothetical protein